MPTTVSLPINNPDLLKFFVPKKIYVSLDIKKFTLDGYPYYQQEGHKFIEQFYDSDRTVANISYELLFDSFDGLSVTATMIIHHYLLVDENYLLSQEQQMQNKKKSSLKAAQQEIFEEAKNNPEFAKQLLHQLNSIVS